MWSFKKEENVENLIKDCNKLYSSFSYSLGKAHYKSYSDLKFLMKENFKIMREKIGTEQDEEIMVELLKKFKNQLEFFEKYPFSCEIKIFHKEFHQKHMPYKENLDNYINNLKEEKNNLKRKKVI